MTKIIRDHAIRGYYIFIGDIDLKEAPMDYYKLTKEQKWLREDSPYSIGGRDTDVAAIAFSLTHRIRELYPINKVPEDIVRKLDDLQALCNQTEKEIKEFIEFVSEIWAKDNQEH